ncbi:MULTISPECIES: aldo/keto reductase [Micromonospora]|uniref:aldo/keto reductase n=1 Tax=Micromonospora TaxID=1873 RepID=UPI0014096BD4|nr:MULTISPECIES: aldo/keto reductase [Micromonospora]MBC8989411.1 aldo/keto reductase [Micromonospora chalcea]MBP1781187.1 aryl-alcohol dehydrogenase-like predicted oxidoreductase [Micromonospora sp. HB375]MBQ1061612.1 aldo/keto reductase [Micromonospora sp. C41]MBQ1068502.1 aldo/keto reductase [Micromonospora sp. D75]MDH6471149.1 aryl-alcohol dehydrogenase-like predicted oxidoreductase [Micromonospora sp. H404/HB375]
MRYRTIGTDPATRRKVSVLSLGAMLFGTATDEATSFAILDRYVEAGGTFIDTSDNYAFWQNGGQGGESEELLGRWRRSRGVGDEVVIATKLGARPLAPGTSYVDNPEGLSAKVIRESAERSRERLGLDRIDLLYAHIEDHTVALRETVEGFAELVAEGTVGLLGASNHRAWRVERARALAAAAGLPGYEVLQYHRSYLPRRLDVPSELDRDGDVGWVGPDLLSYLRAEPQLTLVAYSPLLKGAYVRPERLGEEYAVPATPARLEALRAVAAETGATVNQVVLAWLMGGDIPSIPLVGFSSVAQLEESLGAVDLELTAEQRTRLDSAR